MDLLTKGWFWLVVLCCAVAATERMFTWRKDQKALRPQFAQDVFWLFLNLYLWSKIAGPVYSWINQGLKGAFQSVWGASIDQVSLVGDMPLWMQVPLVLVALDFTEWCVHNLLHRVGWLWKFHRVHHSIIHMDWIGNFRFHPLEVLFYNLIKFLPIGLLGATGHTFLIIGSISILIGNLNHSNLNISWGPLRYLINSPRMHIWHHEAEVRNSAGVNYGVVLSVWDWIFKTAYMPQQQIPDRIGFKGDERVSKKLWKRLLVPFLDEKK